MISNIPENSLIIELILISIIFLGLSVCFFIVKSKVLTFKKEKITDEEYDKSTEKTIKI
ncbi:hypothetical protein SAMN06265349_101324 [Flavobacterium resistens]|uniref:Uncharacterized protein n=1 Tax=Flavobacterium resistens TaxID=443612 RepID=A0A521AR15_9FLAO|nr:hypothetical protein [Flavobacterium resistens]MRX69756.1 hypothetical protein [Flavobacterium resistens]SMO37264.1 hypothetical protein SAMN06265349_101324 [Flavobacterium resistens]